MDAKTAALKDRDNIDAHNLDEGMEIEDKELELECGGAQTLEDSMQGSATNVEV